MFAVKEFDRHFRSIEAALDIEGVLPGDSAKNFELLHKLCSNPEKAAEIRAYGIARLHFIRSKAVTKGNEGTHEVELAKLVAEFIFHNLVVAVAYRYSDCEPKKHHWLPVSYTRVFSVQQPQKAGENRRRCSIRSITFTHDGEPIERSVNDLHFAHGVDSEGRGFYHLNMEHFFCRMESSMAEARDKGKRNKATGDLFPNVATAAFFVVQSVRNPHPSTKQFSLRTINGIVNGLMSAIDSLTEAYTHFVTTPVRMAFTPYVPTRILNCSDGTRAMTFPVGPNRAFIITNKIISSASARDIAIRGNRAVIQNARRTGTVIFGLNHKDLRSSEAGRIIAKSEVE